MHPLMTKDERLQILVAMQDQTAGERVSTVVMLSLMDAVDRLTEAIRKGEQWET